MEDLIIILSDGMFHSGEDLGKKLDITRAAVWKKICKIKTLGIPLESKKGLGYRIIGGLDLLKKEDIYDNLSTIVKPLVSNLEVLSTTTSTNTLARKNAENFDSSGSIILAEAQTDGRGRRGKSWISPYGCNLYLSIVWGFSGGIQEIEGLSLATACSVLKGLEKCGADNIELKWPNDLMHKKKKIGGILLEIVGDPSGYCQVIIGVGININMPKINSKKIDREWTNTKKLLNPEVSRNDLATKVIEQILLLLFEYKKSGFSSYKDEWLMYDNSIGKKVKLIMVNNTVEGVVRGIDSSGGLILEVGGIEKTFSGGEISLRECE
jgi:BirA family biotin operon repressor/biotin-[acetyl-CoA-carboxylase] ligase